MNFHSFPGGDHETVLRGRTLGIFQGREPGPAVLIVAGMHGNEPATIAAARSVAAKLEGLPVYGRIALALGNLSAIAAGERFLDYDLNRLWTSERMELLASGQPLPGRYQEDVEQQELFDFFEEFYSRHLRPHYLLDLHSASSVSQPFSIVFGDGSSYGFAKEIDVPCVIWPDDDPRWEGVMLGYASRRNIFGAAIEAGPLYDLGTSRYLEACVWQALVAAGSIGESDIPALDEHHDALADVKNGAPDSIDVVYKHAVSPSDRFKMEPGFVNLQPVKKGQVLARDGQGIVEAESDGHLLFPLYQGLSDYGFILGRSRRNRDR